MKGLVIKKNADLFTIATRGGQIEAKSRKNMKKEGVFVGDKVEVNGGVIENVLPRKNLMIRPPLANVDTLFIVVAPIPKPDFLLIDKMLIYSTVVGAKPIIVVNKSDILSDEEKVQFLNYYRGAFKPIFISAKDDSAKKLLPKIKGVCAFVGQSAVGKSSLINALIGQEEQKVGTLSKKISRGKQTTRIVSLHKLDNGYIADTAGFSLLDLGMVTDLKKHEISRYYPDFLPYIEKCKFSSCLHMVEKDCAVKTAAREGKISRERYVNYRKLMSEISEKRSKL